jgi:glutamate-1-semialdehyde aminotransferase
MRRFDEERPADICLARGTFNAHPYVMAAMQVFLERLETPPVRALYQGLDELWDARAAALNERLEREQLPVRVANLSTIWTVLYTRPSRYNWMLHTTCVRGLAPPDRHRAADLQPDYTQADFETVAGALARHLDGATAGGGPAVAHRPGDPPDPA